MTKSNQPRRGTTKSEEHDANFCLSTGNDVEAFVVVVAVEVVVEVVVDVVVVGGVLAAQQ